MTPDKVDHNPLPSLPWPEPNKGGSQACVAYPTSLTSLHEGAKGYMVVLLLQ
jgi:hypothetical protein